MWDCGLENNCVDIFCLVVVMAKKKTVVGVSWRRLKPTPSPGRVNRTVATPSGRSLRSRSTASSVITNVQAQVLGHMTSFRSTLDILKKVTYIVSVLESSVAICLTVKLTNVTSQRAKPACYCYLCLRHWWLQRVWQICFIGKFLSCCVRCLPALLMGQDYRIDTTR